MSALLRIRNARPTKEPASVTSAPSEKPFVRVSVPSTQPQGVERGILVQERRFDLTSVTHEVHVSKPSRGRAVCVCASRYHKRMIS